MINILRAFVKGFRLDKHFKDRVFFDYMSKLMQFQHTLKIVETVEGYKFEVETASDYLFIMEMLEDLYGKIEPGWVVIDIGANKGVFTVRAATNAKIVYAYEPSTECFNKLIANVSRNANMRKENTLVAMLYLAVVGKKPAGGYVNLIVSKSNLTNSLYEGIGKPTGIVEKVKATTLDEITGNGKLKVDLIKMDCENSEYDIIYNTSDATLNNIERFMIELHGTNEVNKKFIKHLEDKGFDIIQKKLGGYVHLFGTRKHSWH
jgi:FkbM family methyltransferase